jgi:trk system potassium uptake protein
MKVILVGAGDVGGHLANLLSRERSLEVTVVDQDAARLHELADRLDIATVHGSGALQAVLERAGARGADTLIAATNSDEANWLSCMAAERLGVASRIARIRSEDLADEMKQLGQALWTVNPERAAARAIVDLLLHNATKDYSEFMGGQIRLVSLDVLKGGPLAGRSLRKLAQKADRLRFRVVARFRGGRTTIPGGEDLLEAGDTVTFAVHARETLEIFRLTGQIDARSHDVMILGASPVAVAVADDLEQLGGVDVKLFTTPVDTWISDFDLAERLPETSIFATGGKEIDVMAQQALGDMEVLLALSGDEEKNIITSLVAKHLGVKRTITMIQKAEYMPIIKTIGLDIGINTRLIAAQEMLKFVKRGRLTEQSLLAGTGAQVATFQVPGRSALDGCPVTRLNLPGPAILAGLQRRGRAVVPTGADHIEGGDQLLVVCLEEQLPALESFFSEDGAR